MGVSFPTMLDYPGRAAQLPSVAALGMTKTTKTP